MGWETCVLGVCQAGLGGWHQEPRTEPGRWDQWVVGVLHQRRSPHLRKEPRSPGLHLQPPYPVQEALPWQQGGIWQDHSWNAGYVPASGAPELGSQPLLFSPWGQVWGRPEGAKGLVHEHSALLPIGTEATPMRGKAQGLACRLGMTTSGFPLSLL